MRNNEVNGKLERNWNGIRDREEIQATGWPCFSTQVTSGSALVHSCASPAPHSPVRLIAPRRWSRHAGPQTCGAPRISKALMPIRTLLFPLGRVLYCASLHIDFMSPPRAGGSRCRQRETRYQQMEVNIGGGVISLKNNC